MILNRYAVTDLPLPARALPAPAPSPWSVCDKPPWW